MRRERVTRQIGANLAAGSPLFLAFRRCSWGLGHPGPMRAPGILLFIVALAALAGCGGSHGSGAPAMTTTVSPPAPATTAATTTAATPSQLTPEAQAAATRDIPDNQVFLTFPHTAGGYSTQYPE